MPEEKRFPLKFSLITPPNVKKPLNLSFIITLIIIVSSGAYYIISQPELPLFYTLALSSQVLAPKEWLFLLPSLSFFFSLLHVLIVHWFNELEPILLVTFVRVGLLLQLLLLVEVCRIIYITL